MPKLSTNKLDLSKKWWHRLITVLFVVVTIVWVTIVFLVSDWYFWLKTFFNIFLGTTIWLILTNLIYYEWIIYIIVGKHWNSFYRKVQWYYNKIPINKRKKIITSAIFIVIWLLLLKFAVFPIVSNKLTDIWNTLLDNANEQEHIWINIDSVWIVKKVTPYCKIALVLNKSAKSLKCMWRITVDDYESKSFFLQALNFSPTIEEEIKIRSNLVRFYLKEKDTYGAQQQINILFDTSILKDNLRNYPSVLCSLYIYLWYITIQEGTLSEALSMVDMAWEYANEDRLKFSVWLTRSDMYATKWDYLTALSVIISMQENKNWYKLTDANKEALEEIEANLRKAWNLYGVYNNSNSVSTPTTVKTTTTPKATNVIKLTPEECMNTKLDLENKYWTWIFYTLFFSPYTNSCLAEFNTLGVFPDMIKMVVKVPSLDRVLRKYSWKDKNEDWNTLWLNIPYEEALKKLKWE